MTREELISLTIDKYTDLQRIKKIQWRCGEQRT